MNYLLVIFIDAFRYDYLSEERTPFLYSMSKNTFCAPLKPILGYSDAIDTTIFTGVYPEDHGYWIMHKYSPETSPFKIFKPLAFIERFPFNLIVRGFKFMLSATICKIVARVSGYSKLETHNIPFGVINSFDWTSKRSILDAHPFSDFPTLFDTLRENGIKFTYIDPSQLGFRFRFGSSIKVRKRLTIALEETELDTRLIFIYLPHLDDFAHRNGIKSSKFLAELTNMDSTIQLIINETKQRLGNNLDAIVFSDHGMAETTQFVELKELTQDKGFGKDYLLFLDSTMIHVWYLDPARKEKIRRQIEDLGYGSFLSDAEKKELRLNFKNRHYGDDVYLIKTGYSIFPNFMSWLKPYAMHAYHPNDKTQLGIVLLQGPECNSRAETPIQLVDLAPTILDILGVSAPAHYKGKSLLKH